MTNFFRSSILAFVVASTAMLGACTRIETGTVGLRVDATKQVQGAELLPGTGFHQTLVGDVLEFPVRDIQVGVEDQRLTTSDNTALQDFDLTVVYSINPASVSDLYTKKSKSFHGVGDEGVILMQNYMRTLIKNASYKAIREYTVYTIADKRSEIEAKISLNINDQLKVEGLAEALQVQVVQVKSIVPNAEIMKAATDAIKAEAELKKKNTEIQIAEAEARRMEALAKNSKESVEYMDAQARLLIAQGIREGKVNTIVVPQDFKGMVNIK